MKQTLKPPFTALTLNLRVERILFLFFPPGVLKCDATVSPAARKPVDLSPHSTDVISHMEEDR